MTFPDSRNITAAGRLARLSVSQPATAEQGTAGGDCLHDRNAADAD
jgi:hypothetical protein